MGFKTVISGAAAGALLAVAAATPSAAANLLTNGSFEDPVVPAESYQGFRPGVIGFNNGTPWQYQFHTQPFVDAMTYVVADNAGLLGGVTTPFGNQFYFLGYNSVSTTTIQGLPSIDPGHYTLSFWQNSVAGSTGAVSVDVRLGLVTAYTSLFEGGRLFTTAADSGWVKQSLEFDIASPTFGFINLQSIELGAPALVDNFSLELQPPGGGVPEPATWAMLIAGFGGVGAILRRRTTVAA